MTKNDQKMTKKVTFGHSVFINIESKNDQKTMIFIVFFEKNDDL